MSGPRFQLRFALLTAAACALALSGCARVPRLGPEEAASFGIAPVTRTDEEKARFYWPYAALAAEVYASKGASEMRLGLLSTSSSLRKDLQSLPPEAKARFRDGMTPDAVAAEWQRAMKAGCNQREGGVGAVQDSRFSIHLQRRTGCTPLRAPAAPKPRGTAEERDPDAPALRTRATPPTDEGLEREARLRIDGGEAPVIVDAPLPPDAVQALEAMQRQRPSPDAPAQAPQFCQGAKPIVPVAMAVEEFKWEKAPEIEKYTISRGWRVFVPEFAVDVWRRPREAGAVEYAIVYRGTVGAGGWLSNLRLATTVLPLFWDQYLQAKDATERIVDQIHMLHAIADSAAERKRPTKILITTVGHSLGGGIAQYVYYAVPEITRAVAFNSSPINGSRSLIDLEERAALMDPSVRVAPDVDPYLAEKHRSLSPGIYLLYERGEPLSRLHGCLPGVTRTWGAEGGPSVLCEEVNLATGNWFRQHEIGQLACNIATLYKKAKAESPLRSAGAATTGTTPVKETP